MYVPYIIPYIFSSTIKMNCCYLSDLAFLKNVYNECISKMFIVNIFDLFSVHTSVSSDCSSMIRFRRYVQTLAAQHNIHVVCMMIDLWLKIHKKYNYRVYLSSVVWQPEDRSCSVVWCYDCTYFCFLWQSAAGWTGCDWVGCCYLVSSVFSIILVSFGLIPHTTSQFVMFSDCFLLLLCKSWQELGTGILLPWEIELFLSRVKKVREWSWSGLKQKKSAVTSNQLCLLTFKL